MFRVQSWACSQTAVSGLVQQTASVWSSTLKWFISAAQGHVLMSSPMCVCAHLSLQPPVEPACDHASGVGLDGDDGPQPVPERTAHQEATTAPLEACDSLAGHVIRRTQLPGTNQSLEAGEACSHLQRQNKRRRKMDHDVMTWLLNSTSVYASVICDLCVQ